MEREQIQAFLERYPALLCEMEQLERELAKAPAALRGSLLERMEQTKEQAMAVRRAIDATPHDGRRMLLRCRYLEGMTFEQIAQTLFLSERQIYRWHKRALEEMGERSREFAVGRTKCKEQRA